MRGSPEGVVANRFRFRKYAMNTILTGKEFFVQSTDPKESRCIR